MKLLIGFVLVLFFMNESNASDIKDIKSYQAEFTQSIINNSGKEILYKGNIYINQPSNVLWSYNDPIEKDVYILSSKVVIIEPDLEQAIVSTMQEEINILDLLKNPIKISKNKYEATLYDNEYLLTIINNILVQINYIDEIENKVTIYFKNIKQNKIMSNDIFKYKIPLDYDVIKK